MAERDWEENECLAGGKLRGDVYINWRFCVTARVERKDYNTE